MNSFRSTLDKGEGFRPAGPTMPGKKPSGAAVAAGLGSVPVTRDAVRNANHRDDDRHRLHSEQASLKVGRKVHQVDLINLSGGGAMVATEVAMSMWQKVHLGLGDCTPVECAVRWIRGNRIGLEFAHETQVGGDAAKRDAMLLEVLQRSFPDSVSTPVATPPAQPEESVEGDEPTGAQRRSEIRHPLIWWGEIHCNHDTTRVRLRNISETGALVDSDIAFASEAEVLLDLGAAGQHFAKVTWSRGDQVGLQFVNPFNIALLAKVKPEIANHRWVPPSYLENARQAGRAPTRGWGSASLGELRSNLEGFLKH